jgi:hypothetical protein
MSSSGTGAEITPMEAHDLLNKLMTESTKVQIMLSTPCGLTAGVLGTLVPTPSGGVAVVLDRNPPLTTFVGFKPSLAVQQTYVTLALSLQSEHKRLPVPRNFPRLFVSVFQTNRMLRCLK